MKRLCITILAIVPTAFASCGALSVKFGSAMEVIEGGVTNTYAANSTFTPTAVPCVYMMRPVLAAGERALCIECDSDANFRYYPMYCDEGNWIRVALGGSTQVTLTGKKVAGVFYCDAERGNDDWDGTADYEHLDETTTPKKGPKKTLQAAHDIETAVTGSIVLVAPGVYDEGVTNTYSSGTSDLCKRRLHIYKSIGFIATEGPERTFIVGGPDPSTGGIGANAVGGVRLGADRSFLQGFTITGCYTPSTQNAVNQFGAAFTCASRRGYVLDCVISNNVANSYSASQSGTIMRTRVFENESKRYLCRYGYFVSCVIAGNRITDGNSASTEYALGYDCSFRFCTIDLTNDRNPLGRGQVQNNAHLYGTLVYGLTDKSTVDAYWHDSLACDEPLFADPASRDYRIGTLSPAIDAASYATELDDISRKFMAADVDGRMPFVHDGKVRLGAVWNDPPLPLAIIGGTGGGISVSGGKEGTNVVLSADAITVSASDASRRPFLGFEVDGVMVSAPSGSYSFVPATEGASVTTVKAVYSADWYVDCANGDDVNSGATLALAKRTIRAATTNAVDGDIIHVAPGTYGDAEGTQEAGSVGSSRVVIPNNVTIESTGGAGKTFIIGAAATGNQVDNATYGTGTNAIRCVYAKSGAVMRGFTLTGGRVVGAGEYSGRGFGSAFYSSVRNEATVSDCVVSNNAAWAGSLYNAVVKNCRILENVGLSSGPASYLCNVYGSIIDRNVGENTVCFPTFFESCTVGRNNTRLKNDYSPSVACWSTANNRTMVNCAILGNGRLNYNSGGKLICTNCVIVGGGTSWTDGIKGDLSCNVIFTNSTGVVVDDECRPVLGSFAGIDSGEAAVSSSMVGDVDLYGTPRVLNGALDIGAVEYDWRPVFSRELGRHFAMTYAAPSVTTNATGGLRMAGGEVAGMVDKVGPYEIAFSLTGGTMAVYVGESVVGESSGAGEGKMRFGISSVDEKVRFVFTPAAEGLDAALLTKLSFVRGFVLTCR